MTATDVRGLWVLRGSLSSEDSIRRMVATAQASGFNTLFVQVRGRAEAFYRSVLEPRAVELDGERPDFDPLAVTLTLAHQAGLSVHAWVDLDLVANAGTLPRSRDHVVYRHPEWLMIPRDLAPALAGADVHSPAYLGQLMRWTRAASDRVEGLYLSPIPPAAQAYTAAVVHELVASYALDGLHLDYARYPNDAFDYSAAALGEFRANRLAATPLAERQRLDRLAPGDPTIWARMLPDGWAAFRRERLTELVRRITTDARRTRPGLVMSAAVAPNAEEAKAQRLQDWALWNATGMLDAICPMAYATDLAEFTNEVERAHASAGASPVWAGIGAYLLPASAAADHVRAARRAGASGVVVFSYDSLAAVDGMSAGPGYFAELRSALLDRPDGPGRDR